MKRFLENFRSAFRKRKNKPGKVSVHGPIERDGDKFVLRIPLAVGGEELVRYTKGIGRVDGHFLVVEMMPWMLQQLSVREGSIMTVDNLSGEFRIQRHHEEPNQSLEPTRVLGTSAAEPPRVPSTRVAHL